MTTPMRTAPIDANAKEPRVFAGLSVPQFAKLSLAAVLAMQFTLVFTRSVNWDEFWFYYLITQFNAGELTMPLQTFHARLFAWLPALAGSGIDHIVLARTIMFACEIVTIFSIVTIARRFADLPFAIVAALLYVSAGFVFQHGFSFRTDPMATAALMASLALIAKRPLDTVTIGTVAVLVAVAGLITTKVILYAPAFAGIAWLNLTEARHRQGFVLRCALITAATAVIFIILYRWHVTGLQSPTQPVVSDKTAGSATHMLSGAAQWMFFVGIPPYLDMIYKAMLTAPLLTLLSWAAPFATLLSSRPKPEKIALLGFWSIIFVPLFYKNTAGYFYVFMFAPLAVGCMDAIILVGRRYGVHLLAIMLVGIAVGVFMMEKRDVIDRQRLVQATAQQIFPEPVAYFDHNGMLPALNKRNYLMTPSAMSAYRDAGVPTYRNTMLEQPVPLLLSNWFSLRMTLLTNDDSLLLPEDRKALRENYIPFYGPFWLAGRAVKGRSSYANELLVPGEFTVLDAPILIDGKPYQPGDVVTLDRGMHTWAAPGGNSRIVWGSDRTELTTPWADEPLYVGF